MDVAFSLKADSYSDLEAGDAQTMLIAHLSSEELEFIPVTVDLRSFEEHPKTVNIKVVVVGNGGTGKTCTLFRMCNDKFPTCRVPTVFEHQNSVFSIHAPKGTGNNTVGYYAGIWWWDTAVPEEYERLRVVAYLRTNVVLVVFSVSSPLSFDTIKWKWFPEINHYCPDARIVLGACKSDLLEDESIGQRLHDKGEDFITMKQGWKLAKEIGADDFVLYSNITSHGVQQLKNAVLTAGLRQNCENNPQLPSFLVGSKKMDSHSKKMESLFSGDCTLC
eukprot:CAMPEP_0174265836 /NCGR_PEP_ID=MMETSP0439-20130205/28104_1 /TAXON_ID=0 /ORGANISM="Stereomyxa ramosa, Strain Chinc5" /LENGTH=275 /DNA_ID=CAMNT_0015352497 /DNA_START=273 /DNA_END=1100 /DNA_ORIENTATION=-